MPAGAHRRLRRGLHLATGAAAAWCAVAIVQLLDASPAAADNCGTFADCFGQAGSASQATFGLSLLAGLSLLVDFIPVVGDVKGLVESATGQDLFTGEELTPLERAMGLIPLLPASDLLRAAGKLDDLAGAGRHVDELGDAGRRLDDAPPPPPPPPRHTGARSTTHLPAYTRWEEYAPRAYDEIRAADDVADIARHSGMPPETIERIKQHVFVNEHRLDDGVRRFDPDPDIADAWARLRDGTHTPEDIRLLQHEDYELRFEAEHGSDYRTAHEAANAAGYTWNPPTS